MKYIPILRALFLVCVLTVQCQAADTAVNFSGSVIAAPCTTDSSMEQLVSFDSLRSTDFSAAGSSGDWKIIDVKLTGCPASTARATLTFSGTVPEDDSSLYATSGTAKNIAIQLVENGNRSVILSNGKSMTMDINSDRTATFSLASRVYSVNGSITSGDFTSVVLMNLTYQ